MIKMLLKATAVTIVVGASLAVPQLASAATVAPAPTTRAPDGARPRLVTPPPGRPNHIPPGPGGMAFCPAGHHLSPFDMPIYDGLWVVGHETVWFCIPDDLEPAG